MLLKFLLNCKMIKSIFIHLLLIVFYFIDMKKTILYISLILFSFSLIAQDKPLRVEIEAKSNSDSYVIIPFGEKGVLLFFQSNDNADKTSNKWYFTLYDTNFKEVWTKEHPVLRNLQFRFFDYSEKNLYLYLETNSQSSSGGNFQVLKIDIDKANILTYNSKIPQRSIISGFKVINDVAMLTGHTLPSRASYCGQSCLSFTLLPFFIGLNINKYQPLLYLYNLTTGNEKIIQDNYPGQAYVENLSTDDKKTDFNVSIKNFIPRRTNAMYIDDFSTDGSKTSSLKLVTNDVNRKLNTAKVASVNENEKILIGTYNNYTKGNLANPAFTGFSENSTGIYFCKVTSDGRQNINFYNFSKFKSFYSSINSKRSLKMLEKAKRLEAKGKEASFDYKLLVHDIIKKDSSYIVIAEVYYPEYHTVYYTTYDSYGRPFTTSYLVFDGYRYTNAIIASFNKKGELLWDNSFELNMLTFNLREHVKELFDGDDIILTFSNNGNIASKIIRGNEVVEGNQLTKIEMNDENDKLISDYNSDMEYWYGDYFISYGYQKIKNAQMDKSKRTVFYFNKIAFQ